MTNKNQKSEADNSRRTLATKLTKAIMTINFGTKAAITVERIALMKKLPNGETNLGGRNRDSVEGVILDILEDAGI